MTGYLKDNIIEYYWIVLLNTIPARLVVQMPYRALVPMHKDFRLAGALPPLDAPHHMRADEWRSFREGAVVQSAAGKLSLTQIQ